MAEQDTWKRMVLSSMPRPYWLQGEGPEVDVVISSRVRYMRNLRGHRFVSECQTDEIMPVMEKILAAVTAARLNLDLKKSLTLAERDYLMACRVLSPDFAWTEPGRVLLTDAQHRTALMVNEEDHIRYQVLTPGWSVYEADDIARAAIVKLGDVLDFAFSPKFGYLASSPYNCGLGRRVSSMFHLVGLAHTKRLPQVIKALITEKVAVRGIFGEASRAVGAFVQVSMLSGTREEYVGACDYLLQEERSARESVSKDELVDLSMTARQLALRSNTLSVVDSLRIFAWARWAGSAGVEVFGLKPRDVDEALTSLQMQGSADERSASLKRATTVRALLGL